jgi:hypothetical protein
MGAGIAKQIRERWPYVYYHYMDRCFDYGPEFLLGTIGIVQLHDDPYGRHVINMYAQDSYRYPGNYRTRYTDYEAFARALEAIKMEIPEGSRIGFPKGIGSALAGGSWAIISTMIETILGDDFEVFIYELEKRKV